ncbi:MAG TPA: DUF3422 domain-containing protein [Gammaproteobacteria bacterium]|jgi:uncharacterized membrane-anchored protein|nr:DUF3422 domain-containing protein [Gammaproteobacteria bacterium]
MPLQSDHHHPQRFDLVNELHARPFPQVRAPGAAAFIAFKVPQDAVNRDPYLDRAHLYALLNHYAAALPAQDADHYYGSLGDARLRWERHNEFMTYTLYTTSEADTPFQEVLFDVFPSEWIAMAPGKVLTSALVELHSISSLSSGVAMLDKDVGPYFVSESFAASRVIEDKAIVCSDFRIDAGGHVRFAVLAADDITPRRLGRVVQRLMEIETYKSMAMLTLPQARRVAARVSELDGQLTALVQSMSQRQEAEGDTLAGLLKIAAEIEVLVSTTAFRFSAAGAYEAIVSQRLSILREERLEGRQMISEFMLRRFEPAMRTCRSAQARLADLSKRAARASNLLRTRVDVATSAQNQKLLESMDQRAELQLRLQETVEGLSVVAISYYAVNLLSYLLYPFVQTMGLEKKFLTALLVVPVVVGVLWMTKRIKRKLHH